MSRTKRFKYCKNITKQAIKKAIHRNDIEKPKHIKQVREKIDEKHKNKNWLLWAQERLVK